METSTPKAAPGSGSGCPMGHGAAPASPSPPSSGQAPAPGPVPDPSARPPGPKQGRLESILNVARMRRDRIGFLRELTRHGDLTFVQAGPIPLYVTIDPEHVKEVLVTQARKLKKGRGLQRAKHILGEGLLTSEGDFHLRQRRLSQPAFHRQRLLGYSRAMVEYTARFCDRITSGQTSDVHQDMMKLTLAIVGKTLFDSDIESQAGDIGEALTSFMEGFTFMLLPFSELLEKLPLPQVRRLARARAALDRIIYDLVAERRRSGRDHGDLLSMLMAAQDEQGSGQMSDTQLRDESITLMLAGHETTANALTFTLYLLSQHPEVEAKLHAELDAVLGSGAARRPPTADDLPRLPYTEQVFSESMRIFPPAWAIARQVVEPLTLGGYVIPKGALVMTSPYLMHRNPRFYPHPARFDPERFTPAARAARPKFAYFPFGAGPRNCIGENFAWMEGILCLSMLAHRFRFRLAPGQRVDIQPSITLRPKYGMRMIWEAR